MTEEASPAKKKIYASPIFTMKWDESTYDTFYAEAAAEGIIWRHWNEIGSNKDILNLNPNHDRYRAMESSGILHTLTARHDGRIVGYMTVLLFRYHRDRDVVIGSDDSVFTDPAYRRHGLGRKLYEEAMRFLTDSGAHMLHFHEKVWRRHGGTFLKRYGFEPWEVAWCKVVKLPHGEKE